MTRLHDLLKIGVGSLVFVAGVIVFTTPRRAEAQSQLGNQAAVVALGKQLFNDATLSDPVGMACVSCHDPETGFSYPNSDINEYLGPVPGLLPGRFGFRKPPTAAYAAFLPTGIPQYNADLQAYVGGLFYDGRTANVFTQSQQPFLNPNEMNDLVHDVGSPALVISKIQNGPSGAMFQKVYGANVFSLPTATVYALMSKAIGSFEMSTEVSPFSSKYDAYLAGKVQLTAQEMRGLQIFTGRSNGRPDGPPFRPNLHCMDCHGLSSDLTQAPDLFTNSCYANLGLPRNPKNPYYTMTDPSGNPAGYNPLGFKYIDYGLGDFLYPLLGLPSADLDAGDPLAIDGTFKTPTLRNVDKRPYPGFIKCYGHNGYFKSLEEVISFYSSRNETTVPGEIIDFTKPDPYAGLVGTPLWPEPEWPSPTTLINPMGLSVNVEMGTQGAGQIGNMNLSQQNFDALICFLKTLTDGYFNPNTPNSPITPFTPSSVKP